MLNATKILLRYTTKVTGEENRDRERERDRENVKPVNIHQNRIPE